MKKSDRELIGKLGERVPNTDLRVGDVVLWGDAEEFLEYPEVADYPNFESYGVSVVTKDSTGDYGLSGWIFRYFKKNGKFDGARIKKVLISYKNLTDEILKDLDCDYLNLSTINK